MQAACEAGDVFAWLEGGAGGSRAAADALVALYATVREPWLVRALLMYHARTGSERALELLARAPDHHARLALDALHEQLRGERQARCGALAALAPLVARRPPWLHLLLPPGPVTRELLKAARREREPTPLLHALLALAALLGAAPALAAAHAAELAEALTRPPALEGQLALGARALFLTAYATAPCSVLEALRAGGAELSGAARAAWERGVTALARGVALHPALVTGSRRAEADGARWARSEPHDVLAECGRLALPAPADPPDPEADAPPDADPRPYRQSPAALPGSGAQAALAAGALRPGGAGWFPLGERSGAEAAPHTPLPERDPEPEPAVEATPENTPARLARQAFRFPGADSPAVRPLGRTPPPGAGAGDACAPRLARLQAERRAAMEPPPLGGEPPAQAARPQPRRALPDSTDSEVRELTARPLSAASGAWGETEGAGVVSAGVGALVGAGAGAGVDARALARPLRGAGGAPTRRAASCGPPARAARCDQAAQTVDIWPEPYEFLIADFFAALPDDEAQDKESTQRDSSERFTRSEGVDPSERLDRYLAELYAGRAGQGAGPQSELAEQLALAHAQLMYERWRRELHAERNRRLLGRCRHVRALELSGAALRDRVRALTAERDQLRRRTPAPAPAPPRTEPEPESEAAPDAAERELRAERALRLRAEAALREAEAERARDAAELQRTRGESFEAARHVEALARAALAAERRAEHVRRLRRELLLLAEREARLGEAVSAALSAAGAGAAHAADGTERALRAALARAEAEAEAASARADASAARAHEAEAALGARETALAELKRGARAQAEEGAARLRALQDKYAALLRVVRAGAARDLERSARAAPAPASASAPAPAYHADERIDCG